MHPQKNATITSFIIKVGDGDDELRKDGGGAVFRRGSMSLEAKAIGGARDGDGLKLLSHRYQNTTSLNHINLSIVITNGY